MNMFLKGCHRSRMLCFPPALQVRDFLKKLTIHRCIKTCTGREDIPGPRWPTETWDSLPLLLSKQSMKECLGEIEMCSLKLGGIRLLPMLLKDVQLLAAQKPPNESESGEWKSWLKAQHSENEDHGIWSHHFMGNRWGNSRNCQTLFSGAPKSLQMVTAAMKLKDAYSLEERLWPT